MLDVSSTLDRDCSSPELILSTTHRRFHPVESSRYPSTGSEGLVQRYRYQCLDSPNAFRLLSVRHLHHPECKLRPPSRDPRLIDFIFFITTHNRASKACPSYETISYVWGNPAQSHQLPLLNDGGSYLPITQSLAVGLATWAYHCKTGYLWIDQICIDQASTLEKNHQVQQMGEIYEQCTRVLIWLGEYDVSQEVINVINKAARSEGKALREVADLTNTTLRSQLYSLLDSPWFSRSWIFQEAILPSSALVMLKTSGFDLHALCKFYQSLPAPRSRRRFSAITTSRMIQTQRTSRHGPIVFRSDSRLLSLVMVAICTACSDARDKVYALAHLFRELDVDLNIDYAISATQARQNLTVEILRQSLQLDVVAGFWKTLADSGEEEHDLPTWAISLGPLRPFGALMMVRFLERQGVRADRSRQYHFSSVDTPGVLRVSGRIIDHLDQVLITQAQYPQEKDYGCRYIWFREFLCKTWQLPDDITVDRFLTTFFDGTIKDLEITAQNGMSELHAFFRKAHIDSHKSAEGGECPESKMLHSEKPSGTTFVTISRKLAFIRSHALQSDIIVILHGCIDPVVLHPTGDGTYQVVGCAYVEGAMRGEACTWEEDEADSFLLV